ncbi:sensor histidine kinase [Nonomuraea sp. NPDC050547]|uniref:sensor histidine kinase n=1 Tax=Nonomuraea sp. NPDC050547 TaxID=3364368 RepID=UPI0037A33018
MEWTVGLGDRGVTLGLSDPAQLWWPAALLLVMVVLYGLAVRHLAETAVLAAGIAVATTAVVIAARGHQPQAVAGATLLTAGLAASAWALGRASRRRAARRRAQAAHRAGIRSVPGFAADTERLRLATELHDTLVHRLTGIVVGLSAALRLRDQDLLARAMRNAGEAGRLAVTELDALAAGRPVPVEPAAVDALVAAWPQPGLSYTNTAGRMPPPVAALAYQVVREALTNTARHAHGGRARVVIEERRHGLLVTVTDEGGSALGGPEGGQGLRGLATVVAARGGSLTAGPRGRGWRVRAVLPLSGEEARTPIRSWRGARAADHALVLLAVALSLGSMLLPGRLPRVTGEQVIVLAPLLVLHALPLAWRRRAPGPALAMALAVHPLLLLWPVQHPGDVFLTGCWVELTLVFTLAAVRRRASLPAPLAVTVVAAATLTTGPGAASGALLTLLTAALATAVWGFGLAAGAAGARRHAADARERAVLAGRATAATLSERERVAAGLRESVATRIRTVAATARAGCPETTLAEARAALAVLRQVLATMRDPVGGDDPPPTLPGIAALAARHGVCARYTGIRRDLPAATEVTAFLAAQAILPHEPTVSYLPAGVTVSGSAGHDARRRLRELADVAGGRMTRSDGGVRVWFPA